MNEFWHSTPGPARAERTSREISGELSLSVNTAETHHAHAYRKAGINRRSGLAARRSTDLPLR